MYSQFYIKGTLISHVLPEIGWANGGANQAIKQEKLLNSISIHIQLLVLSIKHLEAQPSITSGQRILVPKRPSPLDYRVGACS